MNKQGADPKLPPALTETAPGARQLLKEHLPLSVIILPYFVAAFVIANRSGNTIWNVEEFLMGFFRVTAIFLAGFLIYHSCNVFLVTRPKRPLSYYFSSLKLYLTLDRFIGGVFALVLFSMFTSSFSFFKCLQCYNNPFQWDTTFCELDRILHAGFHPWQLLHPICGYAWITSSIDFLYVVWFVVMIYIVVWQAYKTRNLRLRMQFLLTYTLCWILLGNVFALLHSSAGPCYFEMVTGNSEPYGPLMNHLAEVDSQKPVKALAIQARLWEAFGNKDMTFGMGVSAMPSMHVAITFVLALLGWRTHPFMGLLLTSYTLIILIGSVHLGWHYAVDGYVGIPLAYLVWRLAGWLVNNAWQFIGPVMHHPKTEMDV